MNDIEEADVAKLEKEIDEVLRNRSDMGQNNFVNIGKSDFG